MNKHNKYTLIIISANLLVNMLYFGVKLYLNGLSSFFDASFGATLLCICLVIDRFIINDLEEQIEQQEIASEAIEK